jgi:hypothetical protein
VKQHFQLGVTTDSSASPICYVRENLQKPLYLFPRNPCACIIALHGSLSYIVLYTVLSLISHALHDFKSSEFVDLYMPSITFCCDNIFGSIANFNSHTRSLVQLFRGLSMKHDTDERIADIEQKLGDALWVDDCECRFSQLSLPGLKRAAVLVHSPTNYEVEPVLPARAMGNGLTPMTRRSEAFDANISHHASLRKPLPSGPLELSVNCSRTEEHALTCVRPSHVVVKVPSIIRALNLEACAFPSPTTSKMIRHRLWAFDLIPHARHSSSASALLATASPCCVDRGCSAGEGGKDAKE